MSKERLKDRATRAAAVERKLTSILNGLDKIPSYTGKARFMDKVISAKRIIGSLAWDLKRDITDPW